MKAAVISAYGAPEALHVKELERPRIKSGEVLIRVRAVAVTSADSRIRAARFPRGFGFLARLAFGVFKPRVKILGSTYSGVIDEVGEGVSGFLVGDEVCGMTGIKMGTYAEYIKVNGASIVKKPKTVSHEQAAGLLFGGTAALYFIRDKLSVTKGDTVLVNGASGAVGTNAVQLASYFGGKVTAVTSPDNSALVARLGAEDYIDYLKHDLATLGKRFGVVLDTVGTISPMLAQKLLGSGGRAGLMVASLGEMFKARGPVMTGTATEKPEDIKFLLGLVEAGDLEVVIEKVYDFKDIVAAHTHADTGKKIGNIVVTL